MPLHFKYEINADEVEVLKNSKSQSGQDLLVVALTKGKKNGKWLEIGAGHPIVGNNTWLLEKYFGWHGDSIDIHDPTLSVKQNEWRKLYSMIRSSFPTSMDIPPEWAPDAHFDQLPVQIQREIIENHSYYEIFDSQPDVANEIDSKNAWLTVRPKSNFLISDAVSFNYSNLSGPYDYLQIDIDNAIGSVRCLQAITKYHRPSVITFEHDVYRRIPEVIRCREESRDLLKKLGYVMIAGDVVCGSPCDNSPDEFQPLYFEDWYAYPDQIDKELIEIYRQVDLDQRPIYYSDILFQKYTL